MEISVTDVCRECPLLKRTGENAYSDITVIVPALNEESTISELLELLFKFYVELKVIVSDDGSKDKTQEIVKAYSSKGYEVRLLDRSKEKIHGLTASVLEAIKFTKTKFFIVLDGDLQHPPEKIGEIVQKLRLGSDLVVATREMMIHRWSFSRIVGSKLVTCLARLRLLVNGITIEDPMSGFFGANTELIQRIIRENIHKFQPRGYKILFDILKLLPQGVLLSGIYFKFGIRKKGHSKITAKIAWIFLKSLFR